jgi:DNA-directed RNA polymerase specialized sigma24 family protein
MNYAATDHVHLGSRQVFEILASQNADMLIGFLRSVVRSRDLIDDLFQETMLTAWHLSLAVRTTLSMNSSFMGYLSFRARTTTKHGADAWRALLLRSAAL